MKAQQKIVIRLLVAFLIIISLVMFNNIQHKDVHAADTYTHIANISAFDVVPGDKDITTYLYDSIVKDQDGNVYIKLELKIASSINFYGNYYSFYRWSWIDWQGIKLDGVSTPTSLKGEDYYRVKYIFIPLNKSWAGKQLTGVYYKNREPEFAAEYYRKSDDIRKTAIGIEVVSPLTISANWWNSDPTISISSPGNNQRYSENDGYNTFSISGTVKDQDVGNVLTIKYTIENSTGTPLPDHNNKIMQSSITANGASQSFNDLSIRIDNTIPEGNNTLKIWAEDNKGGKSSVVSRNIIIDKSGPIVITAKKMVVSFMSLLKIDISATDSANPLDDIPIQYNLTDDTTGEEILISNAGSIFIHPSTHESFKEGNTIKVNITTMDAVGNITPSAINIKIDSSGRTNPNDL